MTASTVIEAEAEALMKCWALSWRRGARSQMGGRPKRRVDCRRRTPLSAGTTRRPAAIRS